MNPVTFGFLVTADHPSLAGHFPGRPMVPGVLLLDHVFEALRQLTGREVCGLQRVKFTAALLPDERAEGRCQFAGARVSFWVTTRRDRMTVAVAEGVGILAVQALT
jgi:3-hydroxyacyl-[acyl-carrier-protein] dehydratase